MVPSDGENTSSALASSVLARRRTNPAGVTLADQLQDISDVRAIMVAGNSDTLRTGCCPSGYSRYVLTIISGGITRSVFFDATNLMCLVIFVVTVALLEFDLVDLPEMSSEYLEPVGSFLTFFVIFYSNQCYGRWCAQYDLAMSAEGRILNGAMLLGSYLGPGSAYATQIVRYLNTAHVACYCGLSGMYDVDFFNLIVEEHNLLTEEEQEALLRLNMNGSHATGGPTGKGHTEALNWALTSLRYAKEAHDGHDGLTGFQAHDVEQLITGLRGLFAGLHDFDANPIPATYSHMSVCFLRVYLPLSAYSLPSTPLVMRSERWFAGAYEVAHSYHDQWYFAGVAVLLHNFCLIGLLSIAKQLATPFGGDLYDFDVYTWVNSIVKGSKDILSSRAGFVPHRTPVTADFMDSHSEIVKPEVRRTAADDEVTDDEDLAAPFTYQGNPIVSVIDTLPSNMQSAARNVVEDSNSGTFGCNWDGVLAAQAAQAAQIDTRA